jgi:hypothetical protein
MTNLQEYLAGTNPTNPASSLKLGPLAVGGEASLRLGAVANKSYTIQYKNDLSDPNWSKLLDVPARSTNWTAVISDSCTNSARYYRVATPQQP